METKASSEQTLILKRDPDAVQSEHYDVLFEGRYVGRIGAPKDAPWFWGLEFHEWQDSDGPQYGNVATLEAAKQASAPRGIGARRRPEKVRLALR